jgi:hypothetical protein
MVGNFSQRDQERLDTLLAKQTEILDARLGLNVAAPTTEKNLKPIGRNRNWQADYEKKQRDEHWRKVIKAQEEKDGVVAPSPATEQTEQAK